ncbi:MAG: carboxypeptidase regulatory-like domain-containing protein [bacterium]
MRSQDIILLVFFSLLLLFGKLVGGEVKGTVSSEWLQTPKDVLVFIEEVDSVVTFETPKHPKMDQQDLTFIPHILPIVVGTTVDFPNNDRVQHNVFSPSKTKKFDLGSYPPREFKSIKFDKPGKVVLLCNVHPEMSAFIIVLKNPYFALTDQEGNYVISNVPAGRYRLSTWHKNLETVTRTVVVPEDGIAEMNFELTIGDPADLVKLLQ